MMAHVKGTGEFAYRTHAPDLFDAKPEPAKPEPAKAADVLDRMASERREWLERMRAELVRVYRNRVAFFGEHDLRACMTGDDAQHLEKTRPGLALPAGASRNTLGVVFRAPGWVHSEHPDHVSTTPGSNGNLIYRWRYVGPSR